MKADRTKILNLLLKNLSNKNPLKIVIETLSKSCIEQYGMLGGVFKCFCSFPLMASY